MNVINKLNLAKDKDFIVGDLVEIIEVTDNDIGHKEYCNEVGIIKGTIMKVTKTELKDERICSEEDMVICKQVCKNKCIRLKSIDGNYSITHSCYTKFRKIK